jgi:ribosome-associated translation inhibitor RaiA
MSLDNITVGSAHVDLGATFRKHAQERIRKAAEKYFGDLTMASVHVAREGASYRCSVIMQMGGQPVISGGKGRRCSPRLSGRSRKGGEAASPDKARAA